MGNECLASTPVEHYQSHFENMEVSELKDHWTTLQVYKIKKIYDKAAITHPEYQKHTHLPFEHFVTLFSQFRHIEEINKKRVFEIFNFDSHGYVDWNNFYSMISVCYFAPEEVMAVIMFMIFDNSLSKQLVKSEMEELCCAMEAYLHKKEDGQPAFEINDVAIELMGKKQSLTLNHWLKEGKNYFAFGKFRKFFNIFTEERLQKELISHFNDWNNLFVEKQNRYVGYVISYKWFESWKLYVKEEYGVTISINNNNPITMRTRKTMKNILSSSHKQVNRVADQLNLRELKIDGIVQSKTQFSDVPQQIKNYDFVHSNIGSRPSEIDNKVLEGQYQEVLKQGIIENRDYFLVSEKVWKNLKKIYDGHPEFRRTGSDFIELHPKILKIFPFKKQKIDYIGEMLKQASNDFTVNDVGATLVSSDQKATTAFYYKTMNMPKWSRIEDTEMTLGELADQVIVFLVFMNEKERGTFEKTYIKNITNIVEINVGDEVKYENPHTKVRKDAIFMGKNIQGKFILHFPGETYLHDVCIMENQLIRDAKLGNVLSPIEDAKTKKDDQCVGIPSLKGMSYINSVILQLYNYSTFRQQMLLVNSEEVDLTNPVEVLSSLFHTLRSKKRVDLSDIVTLIKETFPEFENFQIAMCKSFIDAFYKKLSDCLESAQIKNSIQQDYLAEIKTTAICSKCGMKQQFTESSYSLSLPFPKEVKKYYEIIYVPYNKTNKYINIKKYAFKLPINATFKQYKHQFEKIAEMRKSTKYILMEVYHNNIVKNYSTAKNDITLDQLQLRDTDTIFAYELYIDFKSFISQHYSHKKMDLETKELRIDQFVDCKNENRGWIFGKVCKKDFSPYAQFMLVKVIHKFSKGEQWEITYDADEETVANFPTKSYLNGEQYHIRLLERTFNEATNQMQICNLPLVIVLTNWMRWRQFYYLVYLQMKRFIDEEEDFEDQQINKPALSSKSIESRSERKKTNKMKLNKFKDYLYGPKFPYRLNFVDYDGRCALCFKFLKTQVFHGENDNYCSGCDLSMTQPISWQLKVSDIMVCVDWKELTHMKREVIFDHPSYANIIMEKKAQVLTMDACLQEFQLPKQENRDVLCCSDQRQCHIEDSVKPPTRLNIHLERVVEEDDFIQIKNKYVQFSDTMTMGGSKYQLVGVISIETEASRRTKYKNYVLKDGDQWIQYEGLKVRVVKKQLVLKTNALTLFYKRT